MAILTNPGGGTLSGTTTQTAVNGVATFNNLSINNTGNGYTLRATSSGLTQANSNSFNIASSTATWTGNISNSWSVAGNWSTNQVPAAGINVVIAQSSRQPILSSSTSIASLTINANAMLNISDGATLTLTGNFVNNGFFFPDEGTVIFNGTSTISGSQMPILRNVIINNGATLTGKAGEMKVTGNWTNNGTYNHNNGTITLEGGSSQSIKTGGAGSAFNVIIIKNSVYSNCGGGGYSWYNPTLSTGVTFTDALYTAALILPYNQQDPTYGGYYMAPDGMKKISFAAGATHTITQTLMMNGDASKLATLASTVAGSTWYINPPTGTTLNYVFVSDSTVTGGKTITASNSQNAGNNSGWNFGTVTFSGTGNLNDNSYWSSGYVPGQYDTVNIASGSMSLSSAFTVNQMSIASGSTFTLGGYNLNASGGITNNGNLILSGNESISGTLINAAGSTVTYAGTGSGATILSNCTYKNLVINGSDTFTAGGNLNVEGTLNITTGTFDIRGRTIVASGGITNTGNMMLRGDETVTGALTNAAGSIMTYTGTGSGTTIRSDWVYRGLVIDGSDTFRPNGNLAINGDFSNTSGTFDLNGKNLTVNGSFTNSGAFRGTGTVVFDDASQVSYIHGTTFNNLSITTPGKQVVIDAGATETITGSLTLTGASGNLISLRSSVDGQQWLIDPQGTVDVSYVDVKDSKNLNSRSIFPLNSVDSGNNIGWFSAAASSTTTVPVATGDNVMFREQALPQPIAIASYITLTPGVFSVSGASLISLPAVVAQTQPIVLAPAIFQAPIPPRLPIIESTPVGAVQQAAQIALNQGIESIYSGSYDRAINEFSKAIELNPNFAQLYYYRGYAYYVRTNYNEAITDFNKIIELNPRNAGAYYYRAIAYYVTSKFDQAWADVQKAESLGYKVDPAFLEEVKKSSGREK
jgi:uncharacterized Zn-binding protein involved in type VI secretion